MSDAEALGDAGPPEPIDNAESATGAGECEAPSCDALEIGCGRIIQACGDPVECGACPTGCKHRSWVSRDIDGDDGFYAADAELQVTSCETPKDLSSQIDCDDSRTEVQLDRSYYIDVDGDSRGSGAPVQVCVAQDRVTPLDGHASAADDCEPDDEDCYGLRELFRDEDCDGWGAEKSKSLLE